MSDPRYTYDKVNAIKIIFLSQKDNILLIKEPDFNEWMPGHWGLPGGKTLVKESLLDACKRKAKGDLGVEQIDPLGFFLVEELLMGSRTAMLYHLVAKVEDEFTPVGEIAGFEWMSLSDIEGMKLEEFTEFFNKSLLLSFLKGARNLVPLDFIQTQDYYNKEKSDATYISWRKSGEKNVK